MACRWREVRRFDPLVAVPATVSCSRSGNVGRPTYGAPTMTAVVGGLCELRSGPVTAPSLGLSPLGLGGPDATAHGGEIRHRGEEPDAKRGADPEECHPSGAVMADVAPVGPAAQGGVDRRPQRHTGHHDYDEGPRQPGVVVPEEQAQR